MTRFILLLLGAMIGLSNLTLTAQTNTDNTPQTVFTGYPVKKTEIVSFQSSDYDLTDEKILKYRLAIQKIGDAYFWASRNNEALIKKSYEHMDIYFSAAGNGYIKILHSPDGTLYSEHTSIGFNSITYFGAQAAQ